MDDRNQETHESYGMLQFNRITHGGDTNLFGSSIPHSNTVRMSVHPGMVDRHLNRDWYHAKNREYIQVEMSQAQFAEAITNMNAGSGVPVTIRRLDGKGMQEPTFHNKRMQFEEEFKNRMQNLEEKLSHLTKSAEDILNHKKTVNKGDRATILKELNALKMELASNIPFISASYNEQMDKTTQEAKAEVEAFTINKINELGLSKLDDLKKLSNDNQTNKGANQS